MSETSKVYKSIQEALLDYVKEGRKNYKESMSAPVTIPDWEEPTAEELLSQMKNNIQRTLESSKMHPHPPLLIPKDLYEKLKHDENG